MVTDMDMWIRKGVREALEKAALGERFSFMCGPTLFAMPLGSEPIYLVVVTAPSPILGRTLSTHGLITVPVDQDELAKLVGELVSTIRKRAAADLGAGFPPSAA